MRKKKSKLTKNKNFESIYNQRRFAPIGGRFVPVWVADFSRNRWPASSGLGGRDRRNRQGSRPHWLFLR